MTIDLHTHSRVSDGTASPRDLVQAAARAGLDVVALTDHDTTLGWDEAAAAAEEAGIGLVRGIEVSTRFRDAGVHLLAYLPDPADAALQAELDRIVAGREDRVPGMLERLRDLGIPATEEALRESAGDSEITGRPHVADLLVRLGVVRDRDQAFAQYLSEGGPAYVDRYAADLVAMIALVRGAGGVPVIAHPWGRGSAHVLDEPGIVALKEAGLAGLEVDHLDHDAHARDRLRGIAERLDLVVTGSSDHHGTGKTGHDLGCETTAPAQLRRILDLAASLGSPTPLVGKAV
ncbi:MULTISPECIES: PHP domain-containing protein [unclassified Nocardioides]|uniref:PHP domain-containing protein n=1 Tax=unclassified Nocardioides TaxID=2615069 RepID=UPI000702C504|nr:MULTISPECIES: PHP domain-containing protein [unclassified Nocardioides]KRC54816.1 metal-dependent phosphoesterase [Nocardioides sp. Root79]KRC73840.1 metal-dependent phosphoesterase [Nocardioides sp. Root240]